MHLSKLQQRAIEETKAIFPQLRDRIKAATENLELQLVSRDMLALFAVGSTLWYGSLTPPPQKAAKENGPDSNVDETTKAEEAVAQAKKSYRDIALIGCP